MTRVIRVFCAILFMIAFTELQAQRTFKMYKEAEETFYDERFGEALEKYQAIQEVDSAYEDVLYKIEICKLLSITQYENMMPFNDYEEVMSDRDKFYYYWQGRILMKEYEFEEALKSLRKFIQLPEKKSDEIMEEARRWANWATAAKKFMDNPMYYEIHLLEEGLNTKYAELSPVYFSDNEELMFLSNRDESKPDQFQIYHSRHEGNRTWSEPEVLYNVGTFTRDNSNIEVVAEDGRLFQFRSDKGGDLFYSEPTDTKTGWSAPKEFDSKISSTHLSSHFFINEHEDRIIFAKNVGSKKDPNLDLFQSYRDHETGDWSKPALFATTINSEYNEDSPYLSPDEQTLYFASDGHETMGGYDIFKSEFDSTTLSWSEPVNMGFPVNSPDDELHFKLNNDQMSGYFTSNRLHTIGDYDIFFFWEIHTVKIKGRLIDGPTGKPITDARIFFRPVEYTDMYFFSPTDEKGQYEMVINADDVYEVEVKMENETVKLDDFEIHSTGGANTTYIKDFYVGEVPAQSAATASTRPTINTPKVPKPTTQPIRPQRNESKIQDLGRMNSTSDRAVVRNIYFDFGDTQVSGDSEPILRAILAKMIEYPQMRIEIAGHTDSVGDEKTNQWVSQKRADAVRNWLITNGVSKDRMIAKGYGENQPLATNDNEREGRELNRRIEIIVR
ncbi:OmpA family protein [Ekhidna sp. To15]|uniref:OmpA family protein n=1 Tax=Ekhidna sp. To15 TaxID=3395267 RepID=UPI003F521D33